MYVFFLFLVFFGRIVVLFEKNEVCEVFVIYECLGYLWGLLRVFESGDKNFFNKDCDFF